MPLAIIWKLGIKSFLLDIHLLCTSSPLTGRLDSEFVKVLTQIRKYSQMFLSEFCLT